MKHSLSILFLAFFFMTVLSSCEKKEILKLNTVWGEATINNNCLFQYITVGEGLSNKYWFLPLGVGDICIVKEDVCYFQIFLRDYEEKDVDNFWLILIGCYADEKFPIIGKEYKIVVQDQVNLGNIGNSFYWSGELRKFYSGNPEFESYGIAGLSAPPSHDHFVPLDGSLQFLKGDSKAGEYSISYKLKSDDNSADGKYRIIGKFKSKLKIIK